MGGISWIAVDWGTTHLRVWAMDADHSVVNSANSAKGMSSLEPDQFEDALLELVNDWLREEGATLVIACGMVGARQGWVEADYAEIPTRPLMPGGFKCAPARDSRLKVLIVPGLARNDPADVMRGEETQIAGLIAGRPGFSGTVCMPGTHCKWVRVENGEVADFKTCMTGELFSLLEQHSILRYSLNADGVDVDAFTETAAQVLETPVSGMAKLFSVRADHLLNSVPAAVSRARLSACLIADEVKAMRPFWLDQKVVVLGGSDLVERYAGALHVAGAHAETVDGTGLTVAGLIVARALVEEGQ